MLDPSISEESFYFLDETPGSLRMFPSQEQNSSISRGKLRKLHHWLNILTFKSPELSALKSEETSGNIRRRLKKSVEKRHDSLSRSGCAGMKIKEHVLRDQAALSGLQLGLMAAEHRPSSPLIWMSTRRLVSSASPASLCALPPSAVCQRIALTAQRRPPPATPRSLINILRWLVMIPPGPARRDGGRRDRLPRSWRTLLKQTSFRAPPPVRLEDSISQITRKCHFQSVHPASSTILSVSWYFKSRSCSHDSSGTNLENFTNHYCLPQRDILVSFTSPI